MTTPPSEALVAAMGELARRFDADPTALAAAVGALRADTSDEHDPRTESAAATGTAETSAISFARAVAVQWEEVLEKLPLLAVGLDRLGDVLFVNQHFFTFTGYTREEVIGRHWFAHFLREEDRTDVRAAFSGLLENEFHRTFENPIVDAEGREHLIRWFNVRLRTPEGLVAGSFSLGQEVLAAGADKSHAEHSAEADDDDVVTVCAWCSRVQTTEGEWAEVARFITDRLGSLVSHGLCSSCYSYQAEGRDRRGS